MQNLWPLLGKELFALEHTLSDTPGAHQQPLTEQEKVEKREEIRNSIVAQLYRDEGSYTRDTRHLAFLLLKAGRGGGIVGNPYIINKDGKQQELPYTGLEGYYAGSEQTVERPGMTPGRSELEKQLRKTAYTELDVLKQQLDNLSEEEKVKERQERSTRERIRSDRLAEFHHFREETYHLLAGSDQGRYAIGVQDATLEKAAITETITLPKIPERTAYAPIPVHFTQEQLEGYLFLARLGEIGGDPLARSVLVSQESFTL